MKKKNKPCYFCGQPSVGVEHIPAKQMFAAFECDSITVPSCNDHNNGKSGKDEAIVKSFLIAIAGYSKRRNIGNKVSLAIELAAERFDQVKRLVYRGPFVKNEAEPILSQETAFIKGHLNIPAWVSQITTGLVWDCLKIYDQGNDWSGVDSWSLNYIKQNDEGFLSKEEHLKKTAEHFERVKKLLSHDWKKGWSSYPRSYPPEIYNFKVLMTKERVVFLHEFFSDFHWVTGFVASDETRRKVEEKVSQ